MKTYDMTCPKCGATMNLNTEEEKLCCPYCNHTVLIELEDTTDEIRDKEFAKSYGYHKGKYTAQKEFTAQKTKQSKTVVKALIIVGIISISLLILPCILGIFGFSAMFSSYSDRPSINPFDYIEVSFSGVDGSGRLTVTELVNEDIDVNDITFDVATYYSLSNGDKVRITASSINYKLEEDVKVYTVEGLDEYLKNLDSLTDEEISVIHENSENQFKKTIEDLKKNNVYVSHKPFKLLLITDAKRSNTLYDVYEFTIATDSGTVKYYTPVEYDSVVMQNSTPLTMKYYWVNTRGSYNLIKKGVYFRGYSSFDEVYAYVKSQIESGMTLKELRQ